ncbi:21665_t:CDS:1, partial [Dentiscutata erythropus]
SINQNSRFTTSILVGIIKNVPSINDPVTNLKISPFKFVLDLEDISLIYNNYNNQTTNNQTINAPWLNPRQPNRVARGASPRTTRRRLTNTLTTALNFNLFQI